MNILFADDDPVMQRLFSDRVADAGHQISIAKNGFEALQRFQSGQYQLVVTDWQMPTMDGLELIRKIRQLPGRNRTYIILITGKELEGLKADLFSDVDDLITKPFDWVDLKRRLALVEEQFDRLDRPPEAGETPGIRPDFAHLNRLSGELRQVLRPARIYHAEGIHCNWEIGPPLPEMGTAQNFFEVGEDFLGFYVAAIPGDPLTVSMTGALLHQLLGPSAILERYPEGQLIPISLKQGLLLRQSALRLSGGAGGMDLLPRLQGLTVGLIHRGSREMQYLTAGRNAMAFISGNGKFSIAPSPGYGQCLLEQLETVYHLPFQRGDRACFYTDALNKAAGRSRFGSAQERIFQALREMADLTPRESARELLARFGALPEADDPGSLGVSLLSLGVD